MTTPSTQPAGDRPADADGLLDELTAGLRSTAKDVVPWFLDSMPLSYFQDTDHGTQLAHLRAIIAAKASGRPIELTLRSEDGGSVTAMRPLDYPGVLAEIVHDLPHDPPLRAAKIHTAMDGQMVLDTFEFGEIEWSDTSEPVQAQKLREVHAYASEHVDELTPEEIDAHVRRCSAEYLHTITPLRLCKHWELFQEVTGTDGSTVSIEPETGDPSQCRIIVAVGNATTRTMLERIATRLSRSSINIHRAYLDVIDDGENGMISMLGFVVQGPDGGPIDADSDLWRRVRHDLLHIKWFDSRSLQLAYQNSDLNLTQAEIIVALSDLAHQKLVKVNSYAFNPNRIARLIGRNLSQAVHIADLFLERFDPERPMDDEAFDHRLKYLVEEINSDVDLEDARTVLTTLADAVRAVLRTNIYLEHRYGLAMRIDPAFLATAERSELPYGVFFVHGRGFNGFHVRFRDIARGGVRAVRPVGADQHAVEAERLYDEAYNLAHAQQLKNKDIPEGGSKAAVLLEPGAKLDRSVKGFVDSIIDLITPDPEVRRFIVDHFGKDELLYLGPDENITPRLIEWIVDRARRRGYPTPSALMSSKPGAGINHKEYGVTSEGVTVFLEVGLRFIGIDPRRDPFTVKITGGPDGDVAGNEIKILHRDYADNARIVGIADGSGSAEDPDGLDHSELLRLVELSLPVSDFDRARLGPGGQVVSLDEPNGVHLRNTLHNRVQADAFVPAGGRPSAIHAGNWQSFLRDDGTPSSKLVVEGANLFLTPEARRELSDHGVIIIKDSSANKCGVICSSFEIVACMLLSEDEFLTIKEQFVEEVLVKLRALARREAELLMRLHHDHPQVPLPELSVRLSRVMIRTADAIEQAIDEVSPEVQELRRFLVIDHLPPVLVEAAGDRLWSATPKPYLNWIVAKSLAARMAYREGFEHLETMPMSAIADLAVRYLEHEMERIHLIEQVTQSDLPDRDRIARLLEAAGFLSTLGDDPED